VSAVISLTTIPDRITGIEPCIKSLCTQGLPVYLWAVRKIARSETVLGELPKFLSTYPVHVQIVADRGPITKLLPALEAGFDTILTADDDCVYGEGWARGLLKYAVDYPGKALGYRGRVLTGEGYRNSTLVLKKCRKPTRVDIITGVFGALYTRRMFDRGIYREWQKWPLNDDLLIAAHLKRRGVERMIVPRPCSIVRYGIQTIAPLSAINTARKGRRNDQGLRMLGLEVRHE
jgi:hypothetical protein